MRFENFTDEELATKPPVQLIKAMGDRMEKMNDALLAVNEECRQLQAHLSAMAKKLDGNTFMKDNKPSE